MTFRRGALIVCVAACAALGPTTACSPRPQEAPSPAPGSASLTALPAAVLPDLSLMETPVRQQLTDADHALRALADAKGTAPAGLAEAYGTVGRLLLAADAFDAAEPYLLRAEALAPGDVRWPYYLGHVYMVRPDAERAAAAFERALRLRPDEVAALVWLGNVHLDRGRPELAAPVFARVLAAQPRTVSALFGAGRAALARRDYASAVAHLEQALAADPRASIAHYPLAQAYRALGDTEKAEAHLQQQGRVEVGPPDPLMADLRGLLHGAQADEARGVRALNSRDFPGAAAFFRKGLESAPDNPSMRHKLGTALSLMGDTRGAMAEFEDTIRRSPTFAQAHYSLGVLLASSGKDAEARERFMTAVRLEPNYVEARLQLAQTWGRLGRADRALAEFDQVLARDPRQAEARFGRAMALAVLRRYADARAALRDGVRLHPEEPRFADALARLDAAPEGNGARDR